MCLLIWTVFLRWAMRPMGLLFIVSPPTPLLSWSSILISFSRQNSRFKLTSWSRKGGFNPLNSPLDLSQTEYLGLYVNKQILLISLSLRSLSLSLSLSLSIDRLIDLDLGKNTKPMIFLNVKIKAKLKHLLR